MVDGSSHSSLDKHTVLAIAATVSVSVFLMVVAVVSIRVCSKRCHKQDKLTGKSAIPTIKPLNFNHLVLIPVENCMDLMQISII